MKLRTVGLLILLLALSLPLFAQTSPIVPEKVWRAIENEISGDISYNHLRTLTLYHAPNGSNEDFEAEANWVAEKAREYGLTDVKIMWLGGGGRPWNLRSGEAWIVEPEEHKLGDVLEHPLRVGVGSHPADITAELIDVGEGTSDADYEGKDVAGKIVLASGSLGAVQRQAVFQRGAAGIISFAARRSGFPDQLPFLRVTAERDGKQGGFAWLLTPREGQLLRDRVAAFTEAGQTVRARVKIEADFTEERQGIVEGWIRGTEHHDQQIVLTSHLQEERTSANDDRSGVANMLEIARTLNKLIAEGKIKRPLRDIRFWWVDEIGAQYRYFAENPDDVRNMLVNLNQDMVGAKQSAGSRVQYMSRTPYSRPSFVNDVQESILNAVIAGNSGWPLRGGADDSDFPRPMFSALGTREPYRAMAVPFYDSTDHMPFNDGRVGVPGTSLTNWPDPYIHSSDDDLWQIDATQLRRNAFIVATTAYTIAAMDEKDLPGLAALLLGGAQTRLARDSAAALNWLQNETDGSSADRYKDAVMLMDIAREREMAAVDSLRAPLLGDVAQMTLLDIVKQKVFTLAESLRGDLDMFYQQSTGANAKVTLSDEEAEAGQQVPAWKISLLDALTNVVNVPRGIQGLHGHYAFEIRNLIDGKRSVLDIYHTVRAAALSAGEWYYGPVEFETVTQYLKNLEEAGAIVIKKK